jgi:hypothetical protein
LSVVFGDEHKLKEFEKEVPRPTYGFKREKYQLEKIAGADV